MMYTSLGWVLFLSSLLVVSLSSAQRAIDDQRACAYSYTIVPPENATLHTLTIRSYENFVLGNETAWMEPYATALPTLSYCETRNEDMVTFIHYDGTAAGSLHLGNDQFATYFVPAAKCASGTPQEGAICHSGNSKPCGDGTDGSDCVVGAYAPCEGEGGGSGNVTVSGVFGTVAYNSISATFAHNVNASNSHLYANDQFGYESTCSDGGGNLYTTGERTVFANSSGNGDREANKEDTAASSSGSDHPDVTAIPIYRPDAATSAGYDFDGIHSGSGGCSDYYLSSIRSAAEEDTATLPPFLLLRVVHPGVFVRSSSSAPDTTFEPGGAEYETRYWSVSSHYGASYPTGLPDAAWWTANARMVNDAASAAGEWSRRPESSFIFFLPEAEAMALQAEQKLPPWKAPVLRAGDDVVGVVLPSPDFVVFRYRVPSTSFEGSPAVAPCFATPEDNEPLQRGAMGRWTPELWGAETMEAILALVEEQSQQSAHGE